MTPRQAIDGIVELGLPDGGRVLVSFGGEVSGDADLESGVLLAMLAAGDNEQDVCRAVTDHAEAMHPGRRLGRRPPGDGGGRVVEFGRLVRARSAWIGQGVTRSAT